MFRVLKRIANALEDQVNISRTIATYWKLHNERQDVEMVRQAERDARNAEAHAVAMQMWSLSIEREKRDARIQQENEERYKNLVNPFLTGKFPEKKENKNEN